MALAEALETGDRDPDVRPEWLYNLALCLRKSGEPEVAARLFRWLCQQDSVSPRWLSGLSFTEEQLGDLRGAIAALERLQALQGGTEAQTLYRLAALYERTGEWGRAYQLLTRALRLNPRHAASHKLLADVASALLLWQGTFVHRPDQGEQEFQFGQQVLADLGEDVPSWEALASRIRAALEQAVKLAPGRPTWRAELAEARLADGDPRGAVEQYEVALREAERSDGRWVLGAKHRWQFRLERTHHLLGEARVEDPLFHGSVEPVVGSPSDGLPVGLVNIRLVHVGMNINGFVTSADCDHVDILLDGKLLRAVNVSRDGFFPRFSLTVKRPTLDLFPQRSRIEVRLPTGENLQVPGGGDSFSVSMPHGDGRLLSIIENGGKLDKKGVISPSPEETRRRQDHYLEIYSQVRKFFEERFGRSVFLMYGTLLGYYRDGEFIPGDDDFDAGYVSDETDPVAVKEETKRIIIELVRAGFTVSFNRRGRLFRVQLSRGADEGGHVDLRPLWFQGGNLWVHNHVCLPLSREDFLPVTEGTLRGVPVAIPRNTEAFLRGHYGPGWKVPDPGFTYYASEVDTHVRNNLNKALITVAEYKELASQVQRQIAGVPTAGRFVSVGSQDLYPLKEFIS